MISLEEMFEDAHIKPLFVANALSLARHYRLAFKNGKMNHHIVNSGNRRLENTGRVILLTCAEVFTRFLKHLV